MSWAECLGVMAAFAAILLVLMGMISARWYFTEGPVRFNSEEWRRIETAAWPWRDKSHLRQRMGYWLEDSGMLIGWPIADVKAQLGPPQYEDCNSLIYWLDRLLPYKQNLWKTYWLKVHLRGCGTVSHTEVVRTE